ncbi:unnamed protein product [Schistocephalus solidus]|uniref:Velvet domain-containing protein n=1 Tax=Schistocephalus solidus TaxID=70667 RepID=A0A183S9M7_SCHSO|nr:unnamed protein product [Schistocephalus solidus]
MAAVDYGPLQEFRVRDPDLPSQLQYSAEAAKMEVSQRPGLVQVDSPGLRSVKECRQDDGLEHLPFGVQVNTFGIPHEGLQPAEGLTGFENPLGNHVIDSRVARQPASQIRKGLYIFELSTVDIDFGALYSTLGGGWCVVNVLAVLIFNPKSAQPAAKRSILLCMSSSVTVLRAQSSAKSKSWTVVVDTRVGACIR